MEGALEAMKSSLGADHPDTLTVMSNLGVAYGMLERAEEAAPLLENVLAGRKARLGNEHTDTVEAMHNLARAYDTLNRPEEALPLHAEALRLRKAKLGPEHEDAVASLGNLAKTTLNARQYAEAVALHDEYLAICRRQSSPDPLTFPKLLMAVALDFLKFEQFGPAERYLRECQAILDEEFPDQVLCSYCKSTLGAALAGQSRFAEAEPLLLAGYAGLQQRADSIQEKDRKDRLNEAIQRIVDLYTAWDKPADAERWRKEVIDLQVR
jgi:tetratricopeptide (TPR) repeat protein